jgi:hypothetical protein
MRFRKALLAGLIAAALPLTANAGIDFTFNYADANAAEGYTPTLNGGAGLNYTASPSAVTDELKFTAESLVRFTSGDPFTAGSTFTDYILVRIDQLFDNGSANNDVYNLPPALKDREITLQLVFSGTFIDDQNFVVNDLGPGEGIEVFYDAGPSAACPGPLCSGVGGSLTLANFVDGALGNFVDGTLVEQASALAGGGVTAETVPDGAIDLFITLQDILSTIGPYDPFELNALGELLLGTVVAVSNGNNALCNDDGGLQACGTTEAGLGAFFGVATGANTFHTRTDGSVEKEVLVVPEPGTLALFGLAAIAAAGLSRRRKA